MSTLEIDLDASDMKHDPSEQAPSPNSSSAQHANGGTNSNSTTTTTTTTTGGGATNVSISFSVPAWSSQASNGDDAPAEDDDEDVDMKPNTSGSSKTWAVPDSLTKHFNIRYSGPSGFSGTCKQCGTLIRCAHRVTTPFLMHIRKVHKVNLPIIPRGSYRKPMTHVRGGFTSVTSMSPLNLSKKSWSGTPISVAKRRGRPPGRSLPTSARVNSGENDLPTMVPNESITVTFSPDAEEAGGGAGSVTVDSPRLSFDVPVTSAISSASASTSNNGPSNMNIKINRHDVDLAHRRGRRPKSFYENATAALRTTPSTDVKFLPRKRGRPPKLSGLSSSLSLAGSFSSGEHISKSLLFGGDHRSKQLLAAAGKSYANAGLNVPPFFTLLVRTSSGTTIAKCNLCMKLVQGNSPADPYFARHVRHEHPEELLAIRSRSPDSAAARPHAPSDASASAAANGSRSASGDGDFKSSDILNDVGLVAAAGTTNGGDELFGLPPPSSDAPASRVLLKVPGLLAATLPTPVATLLSGRVESELVRFIAADLISPRVLSGPGFHAFLGSLVPRVSLSPARLEELVPSARTDLQLTLSKLVSREKLPGAQLSLAIDFVLVDEKHVLIAYTAFCVRSLNIESHVLDISVNEVDQLASQWPAQLFLLLERFDLLDRLPLVVISFNELNPQSPFSLLDGGDSSNSSSEGESSTERLRSQLGLLSIVGELQLQPLQPTESNSQCNGSDHLMDVEDCLRIPYMICFERELDLLAGQLVHALSELPALHNCSHLVQHDSTEAASSSNKSEATWRPKWLDEFEQLEDLLVSPNADSQSQSESPTPCSQLEADDRVVLSEALQLLRPFKRVLGHLSGMNCEGYPDSSPASYSGHSGCSNHHCSISSAAALLSHLQLEFQQLVCTDSSLQLIQHGIAESLSERFDKPFKKDWSLLVGAAVDPHHKLASMSRDQTARVERFLTAELKKLDANCGALLTCASRVRKTCEQQLAEYIAEPVVDPPSDQTAADLTGFDSTDALRYWDVKARAEGWTLLSRLARNRLASPAVVSPIARLLRSRDTSQRLRAVLNFCNTPLPSDSEPELLEAATLLFLHCNHSLL